MTNRSEATRLSKSKIAAFEHCPRRLWLQVYRRHAANFSPETLERFRIGHAVGEQARLAVPIGIMIEAEPDIHAALELTRQLVARGPSQPIFEATFQHRNVLVRVDILEPDELGGWRAIEVKASSRIRSYQLADLATQVWVMRGSGLNVSQAFIRHLAGPISWRYFDPSTAKFRDTEVTRQIQRYLRDRPNIVKAAGKAVAGPEVRIDMGRQCHRPFACEFEAHCQACREVPLLAAMAH